MFFKKQNECTHSHVSPENDAQYCPDCGKYVENKWYLTRCTCCNVKRKTIIKHGTIQPDSKFCPNCGAPQYFVESVPSINFIDINFAVLVKEVKENNTAARSQIWVEREQHTPIKLLGCLSS